MSGSSLTTAPLRPAGSPLCEGPGCEATRLAQREASACLPSGPEGRHKDCGLADHSRGRRPSCPLHHSRRARHQARTRAPRQRAGEPAGANPRSRTFSGPTIELPSRRQARKAAADHTAASGFRVRIATTVGVLAAPTRRLTAAPTPRRLTADWRVVCVEHVDVGSLGKSGSSSAIPRST